VESGIGSFVSICSRVHFFRETGCKRKEKAAWKIAALFAWKLPLKKIAACK